MNIDRLQHLHDILGNIPTSVTFDLQNWYRVNTCGTTACAGGYAAMDPTFNKQGLSLHPHYDSPRYGGHDGFWALEDFFGLNEEEVNYLFDHGTYSSTDWNSPAAVQARIMELIQS